MRVWLCYATLQNVIPSFPWIVPGWRAGIKFCHLATLQESESVTQGFCDEILLEESCSVGDEGRTPLQSKTNKVNFTCSADYTKKNTGWLWCQQLGFVS